jgi:hypothetical protein
MTVRDLKPKDIVLDPNVGPIEIVSVHPSSHNGNDFVAYFYRHACKRPDGGQQVGDLNHYGGCYPASKAVTLGSWEKLPSKS